MKDQTEEAFQQFFEAARRDLFPKLKASAMVISILNGEVDCKLAIELGASILFDKPLIIAIQKGTTVSPRLRQAVDEWIEYEGSPMQDPMFQARMAAAIRRVMDRPGRKP